jgi:hypothetical protein
MFLTGLVEVAALAIAFALGVMLSPVVKAAFGISEQDVKVELRLLRTEVSNIVRNFEERIRQLENRQPK